MARFVKGHKTNLGKVLPKKGSYLNCPECTASFYVIKAQLSRRKYCSKSCLFASKSWREGLRVRQTGRKLDESTKEKLSLAFRGEKSSLWMGGRGVLGKRLRQKPEYTQWKRKVFKLGGGKCSICYSTEQLEADHIIPVADNIDLIFEVKNGRVLCNPCHKKVTSEWRKSRRKSYA